jgi:hypothetical protein
MTTSMTQKKRIRKSKAETVLILRTCAADMTSYNGFVWPESGPVEAPDWNDGAHCGNGLHGFLWGEGDAGLANWSDDAKWLVVEVEKSTTVDLDGKVKFPRGDVVYCGTRFDATAYLYDHGGRGYAIIGGTATAGDRGTATAGDRGTATAGYAGTATAGDDGTATAGNRGTATAGDDGTATAGHAGTATAGDDGTATAGNRGTATAGHAGTATAGDEGTIIIKRWNGKRYKFSVGHIGEDGLLPNVAYKLDSDGNFIKAE